MKAPEQSQRDRRQVSWRTNVSSATQTKRVAVAPLNSFSCRNWRAAHCAIIWAFPLAVEQCAGRSGSEAGWKRRLTANKLAVAKISPPAASRGQSRFSPDGLACFHTQLVSVQVTRERMLLSKKTKKKRRNFISLLLHLISAVKRLNSPTILEKLLPLACFRCSFSATRESAAPSKNRFRILLCYTKSHEIFKHKETFIVN